MPESRAERNRRLRSEKRQRMIQSMVKPTQTPEPANLPTGAFSGSEFDAYREPEEKGVYLRFRVGINSKTSTPETYAYWSHDLAMNFDDAKQVGTVENIGFAGSLKFFNLLSRLEEQEGYVHIFVDNQSMSADPENFRKLKNYLEQNIIDSETVGWEFGDPIVTNEPQPSIPAAVAPENKPMVLDKEKHDQFQQKLMDHIRKTRSLHNKYINAGTDVRIQAQNIGINALAKGLDIFSAAEEVSDFLDSAKPVTESENIRGILNVINELEF